MKRDKQQSTFVNIGSSSLLIIFLVLCLTTFAILSLSSAQSDYSFSKRFAKHKTEYYETSSRAELILGEIDQILEETAGNAGAKKDVSDASYAASLTKQLNGKEIDGTILTCSSSKGETVISYLVPSGSNQALRVALLVTDAPEQENYYKIQSWQLISTGTWNADDSLNLMTIE